MTFEIGDVDEISVKLKSGDEFVYKGRGLLKLKKILAKLDEPIDVKKKVVVNSNAGSSESEDSDSDSEKKSKKQKKIDTAGGYNKVNIKYSSPKGNRSAMDLARDMQKQAEFGSNIRF
jgi:hypothetical protein